VSNNVKNTTHDSQRSSVHYQHFMLLSLFITSCGCYKQRDTLYLMCVCVNNSDNLLPDTTEDHKSQQHQTVEQHYNTKLPSGTRRQPHNCLKIKLKLFVHSQINFITPVLFQNKKLSNTPDPILSRAAVFCRLQFLSSERGADIPAQSRRLVW
jgi:hypothetical protein